MYQYDWKNYENIFYASTIELPDKYNENIFVLMARDPYWAFAYWETAESKKEEIKNQIGEDDFKKTKLIIKIFNGELGDEKKLHLQIDVSGQISWYIQLNQPDNKFWGQLGWLTPNNNFILIAVSNCITTPRDTFSNIIDEEWMAIEESYNIFKFTGEEKLSSPYHLEDLRKTIAFKLEKHQAPFSIIKKISQ
ncbi:MAG: DUF4912 domain-containing protein [Armatimonadetes bacterium]|nr:DUF4912 domain-containing protein [Armatimonadota bacterium]